MAVYTNAGGGGGASSDELTAARGDVLKGKTAVTSDSSDEPAEGTLELTGDAADSHVLSGKTYYNKDPKTRRTGTMPNRGAVAQELAAGGSYTVPEGYHNGGGKVTAKSLASQTGGATAADGDVLSGKTYWKDGAKRTGTMTNQGAKTASLNAGGSYTIPAGSHNGGGKVTANSLASQTSANAAAAQIRSGYTAWVNGVKIAGNIASMGGQTITPTASQQTVSCSGKYMTGNIIVNGIDAYYYKGGGYTLSSSRRSFKVYNYSNKYKDLYYITVPQSILPRSTKFAVFMLFYIDSRGWNLTRGVTAWGISTYGFTNYYDENEEDLNYTYDECISGSNLLIPLTTEHYSSTKVISRIFTHV